MAEENKTTNTAFEDLMLALFAFLLVGQIIQNGPGVLAEQWGIQLGGNQHLVAGAALTVDTPIGSEVNAPNGGEYYTELDDTDSAGAFAPGTSLRIEGGPETRDGEDWWKVSDPITGKTGWVKGSALVQAGVGGLGPGTKVGTQARALLDTDVWNAPGGIIKTGRILKGDWGELTKGPQSAHGSRWWFFDADESDEDGWVTEAALVLASDTGWKKGSNVKGKRTTDIYERAGGGQVIGLLKNDEKAIVLAGPVDVGGGMWWFIETEDDEQGWVPERDLEERGIKSIVKTVITIVMVVGVIFTLILLGGIVYVTIRTNQVRAKENKKLKQAIPKAMQPLRNERWEKIQEHVHSDNPNDWRLAIIEADILLDELVSNIGYTGDTLGDKLKQVVRGDMETLENAWQAHKVRNQIAHTGSDFILTKREAQRVIDLYASVFNEFKAI
jgi:hypothetical protein